MSTDTTTPQLGGRNRGGGWNRKPVAEHVRDGTYRRDRHGPLTPGTLGLVKPPAKIEASVASQSRWIRNASDEYAVRNGCRFNERLAEYTAEFFPKFLCHSKGQWAGEPFTLTDWQRDSLIYPLFGWVRPDGTRRFRRSYIEMPKKVGKSTIASGVGLYMLVGDDEAGAEIWSLGADRDQARVVHNEAVNMIESSPDLGAILKINRTTYNIGYAATRSWYRAMSATPRGKQGANLHCAIVDELHEWYGSELWERLRYAFRARRQPLLFVITNAGDDLQSVCYRQHEKAEAILSGAIQDDDFFALICSVPREEAEAEIESVRNGATELPVVRRCTPGLGQIISESDLVTDIRDAIQTPSELPNLLRLTYGVWNTGVAPWLQGPDWAACKADFTADDLEGQRCMGGMDWSKTKDMTAIALVFPDDEQFGLYRQLAWFWMPQATILERQHLIDYQAWVKSGHLRIGGDKVNETELIEAEMAEILGRYVCEQLAFDAMYVDETRLQDVFPDTEAVKFPQTIMQFAGPTAEYERLIINQKLLHDGNPVLTWQAGNVTVKSDLNNNKRPVKPKQGDIRTIDGIVAGIMALRLAMAEVIESQYEGEGAVFSVSDLMSEEPDEEEIADGELDY